MDIPKKTRRRERPQKKWTKEEINQLLDYMLENVADFEQPSAQYYYKKLVENMKLDATRDMVRCKVRYMKQLYFKAEEWRNSDVAIGIDEDTMKKQLRKICPCYTRLSKLLHNHTNNTSLKDDHLSEDSNNSNEAISYKDDIALSPNEFFPIKMEFEIAESSSSSVTAAISSATIWDPISEISSKTQSTFGEHERQKTKGKPPENRFAMEQKKWDNFLEQRIIIEKEKLKLERMRLELEQQRLSKDYELKKMELQQAERLAIMELKYKYNKE